ncbi:MAG TPA: retropepsin-like aspartic protease [Gammaproteobacteria bacterium]|nr:retropepsin-like aspartic protease [Gammaproteobacteria bacterium]
MALIFVFPPLACPAGAHDARIEVAGLLGDKAVLVIDGKQKILRTGEATPEGVKLIAVEAEGVTLEIDGARDYYPLGEAGIGTNFDVSANTVERVYRDSSGMFRAAGSINGYPVNFLVDTGASIVAMNSVQAKRLGIHYLLDGVATVVSTASGKVPAYNVRLDNVAVGRIKLTGIEAVVIEGSHPEEVLLGMSFLGRLNVKNENEVMMLETKF